MSDTTTDDWDVVRDGLWPIANDLDAFSMVLLDDLEKCARSRYSSDSMRLVSMIRNHANQRTQGVRRIGDRRIVVDAASHYEATTQWLHLHGFSGAAVEFEHRFTDLTAAVRALTDRMRCFVEGWDGTFAAFFDSVPGIRDRADEALDEAARLAEFLRGIAARLTSERPEDTGELEAVIGSLRGQSLGLFKFLHPRKHPTNFDTLKEKSGVFRNGESTTDKGVLTAVDRLRDALKAMDPPVYRLKVEGRKVAVRTTKQSDPQS